jgi:hypothetical protein
MIQHYISFFRVGYLEVFNGIYMNGASTERNPLQEAFHLSPEFDYHYHHLLSQVSFPLVLFEPTVHPVTQFSSSRLQHLPYYVRYP